MRRFEYRSVDWLPPNNVDAVQAERRMVAWLNDEGGDGWEVCSILVSPPSLAFLMKREWMAPAPATIVAQTRQEGDLIRRLDGLTPRASTSVAARKLDGRSITLTIDDFGRDVPALDTTGCYYEAYVTRFRWTEPEHPYFPFVYTVTIALALAEQATGGDGARLAEFRWCEDRAHLEGCGIDVASIETPYV